VNETTAAPARHRPTRWWTILTALAVLGLASRLIGLSHPTDAGTPVFDEKHYVPQSWQVLRGGWFAGVGGIEDNPAYGLVVHPPLGKHIEAIGLAVFGDTPFGWRIMSALCAVGVILLCAAVTRRLMLAARDGATAGAGAAGAAGTPGAATVAAADWAGLAAGVLALCDGILFVTGRSGMLDHFQVFFVVLTVYLLLRDHAQMEARFRRVAAENRMADSPAGPRLGYRWWRFAAGVTLGCAVAVKWSGLYYIAFFGVAVVGIDWWRRHRFGVRQPLRGTLGRDCVPAVASLVIVPAMVYVLSWRTWFSSETSVFRHEAEAGNERIAGWGLDFLPDSWLNFLYYHLSVLDFHEELTNSNGHHHPWESKPWDWIASTRGLLYYSQTSDTTGDKEVVLLTGTPVIWFLAAPVLLWGLWRLAVRRDVRWAVPVVGYLAGFLPWLLNVDRQMYLFYAANLAPFIVIGLGLLLGRTAPWSLRRPDAAAGTGRLTGFWLRRTGYALGGIYLVLVVAVFLFFLPVFTGMPLTHTEWQLRMWLPGWT
jgi:dolichyl-phosphate-mannose--protein O-mannosyl transferase